MSPKIKYTRYAGIHYFSNVSEISVFLDALQRHLRLFSYAEGDSVRKLRQPWRFQALWRQCIRFRHEHGW